jgi:8-oxo-dGTP diphosphatase
VVLVDEKRVGVGVGVMILKDGMLLLGKRTPNSGSLLRGDNTWTMPGGKLRFGEGIDDCAFREVLEETGVRVDKVGLRLVSVSSDSAGDAHFVTIGFLSQKFDGSPVAREPETVSEWKWFRLDSLPDNLFFPSERIIRNYLDGVTFRA